MSVIVKDMVMPKSCAECQLFICSEYFRSWTEKDGIYADAIPDWCPLVEVKEEET